MLLTKDEAAELQEVLLDAYSQDSLEQMVRHRLDLRLETIAGGNNFSVVVHRLIEWAELNGRVEELIAGALAANPDNLSLQTFAGNILPILATRRPRFAQSLMGVEVP